MQDEVDRLIADWSRERPDLDLAPMQVLSRVTRVAKQLDHARSSAFALHDIVSWEFDVLAALRRSGEPYQLSPGRLLQETMVTSGTMTNRVDRLAARGLVQRGPDPHDGRGVVVSLTAAGLATVDGALVDLLGAERRILAVLPDADATQLADLLRALAGELERPTQAI
ncbi:MarR family winged helix-turn-helix transcriptional regulator [Raineyella sp. LH-20]|uniref:MarR family winged helix-turn-helix transcriptional regulator n=1 Tax=Raineyella sp. LH-20 TaxID=3081204 RepID=UPI002954EA24|nr:MarR family winged helix-turn-helix transcriptional regulator [Raineyella sp. LH-20]WOP17390.1 MarR family winged helix-turn-helix transcriptional regulator [Raineyella sp. LH-20]